ncbi:MAG: ABC transporter permease [Acidobacteriota bacterium]
MQTLWQDLRYGARMLLKKPGFTVVAVLTLALGCGANVAVFSLVDKLLVQGLPVREPATLVQVQSESLNPKLTFSEFAWADFLDYRARNQVFTDLTAFAQSPVNLGEGDALERVRAELVTDNYFAMLGVRPVVGRGFLPQENSAPGANPVAVLSYRLWQNRFGGDTQVLGRTVKLNERQFTIVGVAPASFKGVALESPADIWAPAMMLRQLQQSTPSDEWLTDRDAMVWKVLGRLKPGVPPAAAQAGLDAVALQVRDSWMPESDRHLPFNERSIRLAPAGKGLSSLRGELGEPLKFLFGIVGVILLIACANVANLLLVRASARRKEIAVRLALGAGRWRLVRQMLTESLLLAFLGGAAGIVLAPWLVELLLAYQSKAGDLGMVLAQGVNWRVAGFAAALSLLTGVFFGLLPALQASQPDLIPALKDEGSLRADRRSFTFSRRALIVSQVALSVVVLIAAGLFLRSLNRLFAIDPGFNPDNVLVAEIELPVSQYAEARVAPFFQQLSDRLLALPGVQAVVSAKYTPLGGNIGLNTVAIDGQPVKPDAMPIVDANQIGPGYHELMGISLRQGRGFTEQDRKGAPGVVVVNEAFAEKFFPRQNALGQRISLGSNMPWLQIVGVARNVKAFSLQGEDRPQIELPLAQQSASRTQRVLIRAQDAAAVLPLVRREVRALDASLAFFKTTTLKADLRSTIAVWRMAATLTSLFGLIALLLAAVGLHGIIAYAVNQRTREIGIRMALGAQAGDVLKLILREGVVLIGIGLALGLAVALATTRLIEGFLYGVKATDPLTYALIAFVLAVVALLACWIPARRATKVDPMIALRCE